MAFLDYLLGGAAGGFEGYERKKAKDLQAEKDKEERAARLAALDTASRQEARQALGATGKMMPAEVFAKYTMPGAEPMQPALTQKIGGKNFVFSPDIAQAEEHRADVMKEKAARAKKLGEKTALGKALGQVEIGGKPLGEETGASLADLDPNARAIALGARRDAARPQRIGKAEPTDDEKRRLGAQVLSTGKRNLSLINALSAVMANDPTMAGDPEMAAYTAWKSGTVQKGVTANKGFEPKKPTQADKKDAAEAELMAKVKAQRERMAGGKPPAAPSAAPAPVKPAAPASLADAADKEARRADRWDQIKAQNPNMSDDAITAQVKREIP